ncbi:hypothetical protein Tco_0805618 [Tanacetum coccineum]
MCAVDIVGFRNSRLGVGGWPGKGVGAGVSSGGGKVESCGGCLCSGGPWVNVLGVAAQNLPFWDHVSNLIYSVFFTLGGVFEGCAGSVSASRGMGWVGMVGGWGRLGCRRAGGGFNLVEGELYGVGERKNYGRLGGGVACPVFATALAGGGGPRIRDGQRRTLGDAEDTYFC